MPGVICSPDETFLYILSTTMFAKIFLCLVIFHTITLILKARFKKQPTQFFSNQHSNIYIFSFSHKSNGTIMSVPPSEKSAVPML